MKLIGKPTVFEGDTAEWKDWSLVFRAYCGATSVELASEMASARDSAELYVNENLDGDDESLSRMLRY